jgi:AcrR family transcriptional regulator
MADLRDARQVLLARIVADVAEHGIADRSLRDLAAAVGSSHRMLLYHFGSRDGLVAAMVGEVERMQRELMSASGPSSDPADIVRAVWRRVSDQSMRPFVQLFFEALAYSSRAREPDGELTGAWVRAASGLPGAGDWADAVEIRLGVAVIRGLLVDLLAGGDSRDATASLERYLAMWASTS